MLAAALVAPLALPAPAAAQTGGAFVNGAEPWTESDCTGDVPIVVGSDAKAQSDIYSAVTLAGVVDTDCVILAGPRDGQMPASERARLNDSAPGGYIVGGTAAVPAEKTAGRDMTRLAGADRWSTAQLVGSEARTIAGGTASSAPVPDTTLTAPDDVDQPRLHLRGAEPWIASDCAGDLPIVVGSDAKSQSDIYSAVTLAGVIGTDCVVLAGPRNGDMPPSQQARLNAAETGGYVVGGTAAVPSAKITGRNMTRFAGADRWTTAALVGAEATGITEGNPTSPTKQASSPTPSRGNIEPAIVASDFKFTTGYSCALLSSGDARCAIRSRGETRWSAGGPPQLASRGLRDFSSLDFRYFDIPGGPYIALYPDVDPPGNFVDNPRFAPNDDVRATGCGLRADRTLSCWAIVLRDGTIEADPSQPGFILDVRRLTLVADLEGPEGTYASIPHERSNCGIRTDGTVTCWSKRDLDDPWFGGRKPLSGTFSTVRIMLDPYPQGPDPGPGDPRRAICGIRTDGTIACRANFPIDDPPPDAFTHFSFELSCGIRTDGTIACWSPYYPEYSAVKLPSGTFTHIGHSAGAICGIRTDGTIACWRRPNGNDPFFRPPTGTFTSFSTWGAVACGVRTDGTIACWRTYPRDLLINPPSGEDFADVTLMFYRSGPIGCGRRVDGTVTCWGQDVDSQVFDRDFAPLSVTRIAMPGHVDLCGLRTDGAINCTGFGEEVGYVQDVLALEDVSGAYNVYVGSGFEDILASSESVNAPYLAMTGGWYPCVLDADESFVCWNAHAIRSDSSSVPWTR